MTALGFYMLPILAPFMLVPILATGRLINQLCNKERDDEPQRI